MLQQRQNSTNIIPFQAPPQPVVNDRLVYKRGGRVLTGKLIGTSWYQVQRFDAIVCNYFIEPEAGVTNLTVHIVEEEDVLWEKSPVCPDCGDHGYTRIVGDDDTPCHCNEDVVELEVTF